MDEIWCIKYSFLIWSLQIATVFIANAENMQDTTCRHSTEEQSLSQTLLSPRICVLYIKYFQQEDWGIFDLAYKKNITLFSKGIQRKADVSSGL